MTVLILMNPILWSQNLILGTKMLLRNQIWTLLLHYTAHLPNRWSRDKLDLIRITQDTQPSQYHLLLCQEISTIPRSLLYSSAIGRNPLIVKAHMISGSLPVYQARFQCHDYQVVSSQLQAIFLISVPSLPGQDGKVSGYWGQTTKAGREMRT